MLPFHIAMTNSRSHAVLTAVLPLFVLGPFAGAQVPQTPTHPIVLHAARLLDIESGKIVSPGEVLVDGERIAEAGSVCHAPSRRGDDRSGRPYV